MDDTFFQMLVTLMSPDNDERKPAEEAWHRLLQDDVVFCAEQLVGLVSDASQVCFLPVFTFAYASSLHPFLSIGACGA